MELHQVKGKQNKRPDEKYQSYISDFVKNNPTKHEIVLVEELQNTNLMNVQDVVDDGIVSKTLHNNPEIDKILKIKHAGEYRPDMPNIPKSFSRAEELRYDLFKEAARDLARQNKSFIDKDDILNHLREKYLPTEKAKRWFYQPKPRVQTRKHEETLWLRCPLTLNSVAIYKEFLTLQAK
jgi:hypothetical protein